MTFEGLVSAPSADRDAGVGSFSGAGEGDLPTIRSAISTALLFTTKSFLFLVLISSLREITLLR
ncbi:MAG: hypothetical protein WCS96_01895 [Victivallales bacterium]